MWIHFYRFNYFEALRVDQAGVRSCLLLPGQRFFSQRKASFFNSVGLQYVGMRRGCQFEEQLYEEKVLQLQVWRQKTTRVEPEERYIRNGFDVFKA